MVSNLTTLSTYFGRIVCKQISARKWEVHVDDSHVFTTNRGMKGVLKAQDFWANRLDSMNGKKGDDISKAARTEDRGPACPDGWLIVDKTTNDSDPWVLDDNWHRGSFIVYTVRGTDIREEEQTTDKIGGLFTRLMGRIKRAGYVGYVVRWDRYPVSRSSLHRNLLGASK